MTEADQTTDPRPMRCSAHRGARRRAEQGARHVRANREGEDGADSDEGWRDVFLLLCRFERNFDGIRKPLCDNELALMQPLQVNGNRGSRPDRASTRLRRMDLAGLTLPIADPADARAVASAITYSRRYGLLSLIGLSPTDEDDDRTPPSRPPTDCESERLPAPSKPAPTPIPPSPAPVVISEPPALSRRHRRRSLSATPNAGECSRSRVNGAGRRWTCTCGSSPRDWVDVKIAAHEYGTVVSLLLRAAPEGQEEGMEIQLCDSLAQAHAGVFRRSVPDNRYCVPIARWPLVQIAAADRSPRIPDADLLPFTSRNCANSPSYQNGVKADDMRRVAYRSLGTGAPGVTRAVVLRHVAPAALARAARPSRPDRGQLRLTRA